MTGFSPGFQDRLDAMIMGAKGAGYDPRITSGFRAPRDQMRAINQVAQRLYGRPANMVEMARGIPGYAAAPGRSQHQSGQAADFKTGPALDWIHKNAGQYGIAFPLKNDTVHGQMDVTRPVPVGPVASDAMDPSDIDKSPSDLAMRGTGGGGAIPPGSAGAAGAAGAAVSTGATSMVQPQQAFSGMTPEQVQQARQFGNALMTQGVSAQPVGHWTQALARVLQAGSGAAWSDQANRGQREGQGAANQLLAQALQNGTDSRTLAGQALANPWSQGMGQALAMQSLKPPALTNDQKNFNAAQANPAFKQHMIDMKQAGRPQTTVDMRGETEESKALGKARAEGQKGLYERATASADQMRQLAQLQANLERVTTGPTANLVRNAAAWAKDLGASPKFLESIGITKDFVGDSTSIQSISSRMLVDLIGKGGFPANNFSNADREFLMQVLPQLANDPRANKIIVEAAKRAAQANIDTARAWREAKRKESRLDFMDWSVDRGGNVADRYSDLVAEARKLLDTAGQGYGNRGGQPAPAAQVIDATRQRLQAGQLTLPQLIDEAKAFIGRGGSREQAIERLRQLDPTFDPAQAGI